MAPKLPRIEILVAENFECIYPEEYWTDLDNMSTVGKGMTSTLKS
jgi:hypothetical protein